MDSCRAGSTVFTAVCSAFTRIIAFGLAAFLTASLPAAAQPGDLSDLAARVIDAVVNISTTRRANENPNPDAQGQRPAAPETEEPPRPQRSLGSGFVIDASGIIVTNEHVIRNAEDIDVILSDGTSLRAELLGRTAT